MKGAAVVSIMALVVILIVAAMFVLDKTIVIDEQISISRSATEVYSTVHCAELTKRTVESAAYFEGQRAESELASRKFGYDKWSKGTPTKQALLDQFAREVETRLDRDLTTDRICNKSVSWGTSDVTTEAVDGKYYIKGSKPFTMANSGNPKVEISDAGNFHAEADPALFNVVDTALSIIDTDYVKNGYSSLEGTEYGSDEAFNQKAAAMQADLNAKYAPLKFEVTFNGSIGTETDTGMDVSVGTQVKMTDDTKTVGFNSLSPLELTFATETQLSMLKGAIQ